MSEEREFKQFTDKDELANWLIKEKAIIISTEEADLLLGYFEGHDFGMGIDQNNNLLVKDIAEENGEIFDYTFSEIVDRVSEWNYELLKYNEDSYEKDNLSFQETINCKNKIASLRNDSKSLEMLSNRLDYNEKVKKFVNDFKVQNNLDNSKNNDLNEKSLGLINNIIQRHKRGR